MTTKVFTEIRQSNYLVEQLASRTKFKNDVVVLAGLREVKELDDIRMVDLPHDLHLFKDVGSLRGNNGQSRSSVGTSKNASSMNDK